MEVTKGLRRAWILQYRQGDGDRDLLRKFLALPVGVKFDRQSIVRQLEREREEKSREEATQG